MAKYDPLEAQLARRGEDEFELGFAEIERMIGGDLPQSASRPQWWANETRADGHAQCRAWRNAGYDAFLLPRSRVLFRRRPGMTAKREPATRYVVTENLTEEQVAEAKEKLHDLARALGRVSAQACHKMRIRFDMDDPEVAREVTKMTFEAMFLSAPKKPQRTVRARRKSVG